MKQLALKYLQEMTGNINATFHIDQWESIEELVVQKNKLLVVQKTGWGKSAVYFISTKILRQQRAGLSIIISPLISLMRNQIESAEKLGLEVVTINSSLTPGPLSELVERIHLEEYGSLLNLFYLVPERKPNIRIYFNML